MVFFSANFCRLFCNCGLVVQVLASISNLSFYPQFLPSLNYVKVFVLILSSGLTLLFVNILLGDNHNIIGYTFLEFVFNSIVYCMCSVPFRELHYSDCTRQLNSHNLLYSTFTTVYSMRPLPFGAVFRCYPG